MFAYNVLDPLSGMSDNPLALIIKYWKRGDIDTATELTNTFTNTIYSDPNAGTINTLMKMHKRRSTPLSLRYWITRIETMRMKK